VSLRRVVLFNIGPPFGGFRFAVRPGAFGLDSPEAARALEQAVANVRRSSGASTGRLGTGSRDRARRGCRATLG
jgi:hypothetical protein